MAIGGNGYWTDSIKDGKVYVLLDRNLRTTNPGGALSG
jgi:hypothetical protein